MSGGLAGCRVLVAHPGAELYGSDRVALAGVEALVALGADVVVALPGRGPLVAALEAAGAQVEICRCPVLRKDALRPRGALRLTGHTAVGVVDGLRLLRRWRPDVVYVSTLTLPLWLVLARAVGRPAVCHVHEAESGAAAPVRRALALPLVVAGRIVANSDFSRGVLTAAMPRVGGRATVVPNPVPGPPGGPAPARATLEGPVRVAYVGRLSARKGPQVAVVAMGELRERGVDAQLDLAGSTFPGYEWFGRDLRADVARAGLGDRVRFLGFRTPVWPVLAKADVVVVPSVADEPFGNVAVEAALAARPAVVSAIGGLPEACAGRSSAQLVPPGDAAAVADAIGAVVSDWPRWRAAAAADARVAADAHGPDRYGERLAEIVRAAWVERKGVGVATAPGAGAERPERSRPERPQLVVVVPTYRRPEGLAGLVSELRRQVAETPCDGSIVVVDNDPAGSAAGGLTAAAGDGLDGRDDPGEAVPVRVVCEPEPGIAAARNRGLAEAGDADLLVFIDDDERPEPGWLRALVSTWRGTTAAAVVGPVVSVFPGDPPPWIAAGGFFERRRLPTGTEVSVAATNNLLLDLAHVRRAGLRFDTRFGISGGSDTLFTRALHQAGGRMVWCAEAMVVDVVPAARMSRGWVLRRALRSGNSASRVAVALADGPAARARERVVMTALGGVRIAGGAARWVAGVPVGSGRLRARGARTLARGLGFVTGAWGWTYREYRR